MELAEYEILYQLEDSYWWYVARRKLIAETVRRQAPDTSAPRFVLDVGCGAGGNEAMLAEFGKTILMDASPAAMLYCSQRGAQRLLASSGSHIALKDNSIDLITALDVLEHLDRDMEGLQEIQRVLKPGGHFVATVPAFGFLWSEHDEALHHRRRYTSYELRNKLAAAGFEVVRCTYFITFLFFPIAVIRVLQGIFKKNAFPKTSHVILPRLINSAISMLLDLERLLCRWINLPFGVSLLIVGTKQGSGRMT
ncbi:MAG: class I SAM-dependent methyltransferase [Bryobacterales bacterium]|nr:class I SAM-dependent methyltransferase [Bryobacterales bacterium]